jgi:hypothetical protein
MQPFDQPIALAWRQKVAAYWALSWPAAVAGLVVLSALLPSDLSPDHARSRGASAAVGAGITFLAVQALLTRRLVRKDFRSFCVVVVRSNGAPDRSVSSAEGIRIWLWILVAQVGLFLVAAIGSAASHAQAISSLTTLADWLIVGPYSIALAINSKYQTLRLQAYGIRYI